MQHSHAVAEISSKIAQHLRRKRYLRHKHYCRLALVQSPLYRVDIYQRFAASRHPVKQDDVLWRVEYPLQRKFLRRSQCDFVSPALYRTHRLALDFFHTLDNDILVNKRFYRACGKFIGKRSEIFAAFFKPVDKHKLALCPHGYQREYALHIHIGIERKILTRQLFYTSAAQL